MSQRTQRVNGVRNSLQSTVDNIEREFEKLQKQVRSRGRELEKRFSSERRRLESRGRKQLDSVLSELRKNRLAKQARSFRKDATRQLEAGMDGVLGLLQIASKTDIDRVDRKIRRLTKKLDAIVKTKAPSARAEARHAASA